MRGQERTAKKGGREGLMWALIYLAAFVLAFGAGAASNLLPPAWAKDYTVEHWDNTVGTAHLDLPYGDRAANKFDLYLPADQSRDSDQQNQQAFLCGCHGITSSLTQPPGCGMLVQN